MVSAVVTTLVVRTAEKCCAVNESRTRSSGGLAISRIKTSSWPSFLLLPLDTTKLPFNMIIKTFLFLYMLLSNTFLLAFIPSLVFMKGKAHEYLNSFILGVSSSPPTNEVTTLNATKESAALQGLNVAIAGAGPSGLLLAHRLLKEGARCTIFESRGDPRMASNLEGGAYALGLGIRGRTAIKGVDEALWQNIKIYGYESERFDLHLSENIRLRLRDASAVRKTERYGDEEFTVEPSLLIYQSELCSAFLDELDRLYSRSDLMSLKFNTTLRSVDFTSHTVHLEIGKNNSIVQGPFDLVVGCDGVFSNVRKSMNSSFPFFQSAMGMLTGVRKLSELTRFSRGC